MACIHITIEDDLPPQIDFQKFLSTFLKNSQFSLKMLQFDFQKFLTLPNILFPNLIQVYLTLTEKHNTQVEAFHQFIQTVLQNANQIEEIVLSDIHKVQRIGDLILQKYPNHYIFGKVRGHLNYFPVKIGVDTLDDISDQRYASEVIYLGIRVDAFTEPFDQNFEHTKTKLSVCSKLKGIFLYTFDPNLKYFNFDAVEEKKRKIWEERISLLQKCGIQLLNKTEYKLKLKEFLKSSKWGFIFV